MLKQPSPAVNMKGVPLWKHISVCVAMAFFWVGVAYAAGWMDDKPPMAIAVFVGLVVLLGLYYLVTHYKPDGTVEWTWTVKSAPLTVEGRKRFWRLIRRVTLIVVAPLVLLDVLRPQANPFAQMVVFGPPLALFLRYLFQHRRADGSIAWK
jgi:glucose-6-phosphate-specific signal transduction histidine kinase